jgi:hypothetical protein
MLIRRRLDMEHHALRLRSDGTIDTDYYVSRARALRQERARLIDETRCTRNGASRSTLLPTCFGAFAWPPSAQSQLSKPLNKEAKNNQE